MADDAMNADAAMNAESDAIVPNLSVAPAADAPARPRVVAWAVTVTKDGPVADGAAVSAARRPFP